MISAAHPTAITVASAKKLQASRKKASWWRGRRGVMDIIEDCGYVVQGILPSRMWLKRFDSIETFGGGWRTKIARETFQEGYTQLWARDGGVI